MLTFASHFNISLKILGIYPFPALHYSLFQRFWGWFCIMELAVKYKLLLLLLLLLNHFSRVWLCDPIDGSPPGSLSLGFSRQEHWSGLSFPSPMHESEKWKWSRSVVSDSYRPHGLQPTRLLHPWDFPGKSTWVGCHCLLQNISYLVP